MRMAKRQLSETLWEDKNGFCKIVFDPNYDELFFIVGGLFQIIHLKLTLDSSFITFLNTWHESKKFIENNPELQKEQYEETNI